MNRDGRLVVKALGLKPAGLRVRKHLRGGARTDMRINSGFGVTGLLRTLDHALCPQAAAASREDIAEAILLIVVGKITAAADRAR